MGLYDSTNCIPIDLEIKGSEKKNKEIESFINYVKENDIDVNNLIFIFDRAYFSYDLINFLIEKN